MWNYAGSNWSHWTNRFNEKFGSHTRKILNRSTTKDSCTWNITCNMESTAVWNLKHEQWGSQLVQEEKYSYRGEKDCDRRHKSCSSFFPTHVMCFTLLVQTYISLSWLLAQIFFTGINSLNLNMSSSASECLVKLHCSFGMELINWRLK
jgi:hypothetical protein